MTKVIAKVVVINGDGQVLLLRRSQSDTRRPGQWDFPGGGVDEGESYAEAAARELMEEAGITCSVESLDLLYTATEFLEPQAVNVCRMLYAVRMPELGTDIVLSFEHDEAKWVSPEQVVSEFPHPVYGVGTQYALDHNLLP